MIFDQLENWACYPLGPAWQKAFAFLRSLTPDAAAQRYELEGEDIYAQISSYDTIAPETTALETHDIYTDIQTVLSGRERMVISPRQGLTTQTPYDPSQDIAFYEKTGRGAVSLNLTPGTFVLFYPQDAHMPGLHPYDSPERVKKVVIKIRTPLLGNQAGAFPDK